MSRQDMPFGAPQLLQELRALPPARRYWIGFSGGADSTALLHAALELRAEIRAEIIAVHVNHGLQEHARAWERHCMAFCDQHRADLVTRRVQVAPDAGKGLEAEARSMRYDVFEELLDDGDLLLTGHHREDQAETVLLNLMRASGVDGLAGMPRIRACGRGLLARPLLRYPMRSLRAYLEREQVTWIEDPSNAASVQDRNYVRNEIVPKLQERWPDATGRLSRSADYCRQAAEALQRTETRRLRGVTPHQQVLVLAAFDEQPLDFPLLVRQWLKLNDAPALPAAQLEELRRQVFNAGSDNRIKLAWSGWVLHEFGGSLWLQSQPEETRPETTGWNGGAPASLGGVPGRLEFQNAAKLEQGGFEIKFRQGGESIQSGAGGRHRSLKDLLRELGIPPWFRNAVPLLFRDDRLIAVADLAYDAAFRRQLARHGARLLWTPGDPLLCFARENALGRAVDPL